MKAQDETIFSVIDGYTPDERLLLVLVQPPGGSSRIELRQQSWADGVQWYTQSSICLQPQQVAALRGALGGASVCCQQAANRLTGVCPAVPAKHRLRVVQADSA
jgi:hypothetical protein